MTLIDAADLALLNGTQRDFPLEARPFAAIGRSFGRDEAEIIAAFARLKASGVLARIGALVRPHSVGASVLAAIRVPDQRLEEVATIVNAERGVNHNYQREHDFNLWFVATAADAAELTQTLGRISQRCGLPVMPLPLLQAYHLDLGFPLQGGGAPRRAAKPLDGYRPTDDDRAVLAQLEAGLPLTPRPFETIAQALGSSERDVIARLTRLCASDVVSRFGSVARHRALGYVANAMAVWDIPDDETDAVAARFVDDPRVTLCYRRARFLPDWQYNLFCMVHARSRAEAMATIADLNAAAATAGAAQAVLFSTRCFKQRAAAYARTPEAAVS